MTIDSRNLLIATAKPSDFIREIYATLDRNKLRFEKCAESAGTGNLIHAQFVIDTNGRASDVSVDCVKPTVTGLRECVVNVLSELRLPAPQNGPFKMNYSIDTGAK